MPTLLSSHLGWQAFTFWIQAWRPHLVVWLSSWEDLLSPSVIWRNCEGTQSLHQSQAEPQVLMDAFRHGWCITYYLVYRHERATSVWLLFRLWLNIGMFFIVICVLCQCPLPSLKCDLLSNLWVPSPRLWWMACMWWVNNWCLEWHLYFLWGSSWVHFCSATVFFHSFCAPAQSQVFIHNIDVLHQ